MNPFVFQNPTKIIFGEGVSSQVGAEAKAAGCHRVLFVYGQNSIKKTGLYDAVIRSLQAAGVEAVEFGGVKSNPLVSHARAGIALAKAQKVDGILAVGGGSVIAEATGIAAGALAECDVWDFYAGKATLAAALPLVTVLTNPATASEMNGGSVLTHDETREKFGFFALALHPKASLLDPALTCSIPAATTAYSAVDILSHLLEGYLTHRDPWLPIQDGYVEAVALAVMESAERILSNPNDLQARATLMWGATLAWNGLGTAGIGAFEMPNHMLEHPLSGLFDVAHGQGLSVIIPAWMTFDSRKSPARHARFARKVMGIQAADDDAAALEGIAALKAWFEKIGSPTTFAAAGIPESAIGELADHAKKLGALWGITSYSLPDIEEIYRLAL